MNRTTPLIYALLGVLLGSAPARADQVKVHYHSRSRGRPHLHGERASGGWTPVPGLAMRREHGSWWRADAPLGRQFLFNDGGRGWDHAPGGGNYHRRPGLRELWVKDGQLSYAPPGHGTIQRLQLRSRALGGEQRELLVYLPPGYDPRGSKRYDLLVMQDGQNLFRPGGWGLDRTLEREAAAGRARQVIVVGVVAGRRRNTDSTPTYDPDKGYGGGADRFLRFHTDELLPFVRRRFRVKAGPQHTVIGGSSMPGLFSTYAHLTRPDVFGAAISMSPSYWWHGKKLLRQIAEKGDLSRLRLYMDSSGSQVETAHSTTRELRGILESKGVGFGRGYWHLSVERHGHDEASWGERFPLALRTVFPAP